MCSYARTGTYTVCVHTYTHTYICMYVPWCYVMTKIVLIAENKIVHNNEIVSSNFSKGIAIAISDFV